MKQLLYIHLLLFILLASCSKNDDPTPIETSSGIQIAEKKTADGVTVILLSAHDSLTVAYNKLYVALKDAAGNRISNAAVTLSPEMNMMTMKHSCPVEQPSYNPETGAYEGAVVFSMPTGEMGSWTLTVTVNGEPVVFDVRVKAGRTNTKYTGTFQGSDGISYTVSLVNPLSPKIGLNDLELLINQRQDMMTFPPDGDFLVDLTPEMPSMGHGSPNNVNPVHTVNGHYIGKVNFTMTGDWRLHLRLKKGNTVIVEDAALDLFF